MGYWGQRKEDDAVYFRILLRHSSGNHHSKTTSPGIRSRDLPNSCQTLHRVQLLGAVAINISNKSQGLRIVSRSVATDSNVGTFSLTEPYAV
jgi:hypothetical protein